MPDSLAYRFWRYLNEHGKQNLITLFLWRLRAATDDRTRLKQEVRLLKDALEDTVKWMRRARSGTLFKDPKRVEQFEGSRKRAMKLLDQLASR